jgi:hypothetical protein
MSEGEGEGEHLTPDHDHNSQQCSIHTPHVLHMLRYGPFKL